MWNVEDLMIDADMRGDDGSYAAVVDTLAALGDDARKARKENGPPLHNANSPDEMHIWEEGGDGLICRCGITKPKESGRGDAEPTQAASRVQAPAGVAATAARSEHASALRQLRERIERTMAHAQDTQRWLSADFPPTEEARWRLTDAQRHLLRARNAVWAAEEKMRND